MENVIRDEMGMTAKDLIDMKDPVVDVALDEFLIRNINFDEFKRIVFNRLRELTGKNKLTEDYDRAMRGI